MNADSLTLALVRVETADGLYLDGSFQSPHARGASPVDAFLLIHGTGSNFYASGVLEIFAAQALADGAAVLRINTRGHDGISSIAGRKGTRRGGAAYERVHDSPLDITAWIDWLSSRGCRRIILVGHSMGGVKAIYSQANARHTSVRGIIGISPPRFAHECLAAHERGATFREEFAQASALVASRKGETLIKVTQPLPFVATAAVYVEKYGPENRYDYVPLLARLACPALILIGGESIHTSAAFDGAPAAIAAAVAGQNNVVCEVVDGANIHYAGREALPYLLAASWFKSSL